MSFAVGIDVSKDKFDVAIFRTNSKHRTKAFSNNPKGFEALLNWLKPHGSDFHFCMEATGVYSEGLAEFLDDKTCRVSVVNPSSIKSFGMARLSRTKTDEADAKLILDYCQTIEPERWNRPSKEKKLLAKLVKLEVKLGEIRRQLANFREGCREPVANEHALEIEAQILEEENGLSEKISQLISNNPELKHEHSLLLSIPGLGQKSANQLIALLPALNLFESSKQLEAFAGMNPYQRVSGTSVNRRAQISKQGNKLLRRIFYMPAMSSMQRNPALVALNNRLLDKGKAGKLRVAACMRRIIRWVFAVLRSNTPFNLELAMPKS